MFCTRTLKRFFVFTTLLVLLAFPAFGSMVSFMVVETGLNDNTPGTQHGSVWEGGLMEVFFDAGFIVTNSPARRMERRPEEVLSGSILEDFEDAILGGADYFIIGFMECQLQDSRVIPTNMNIKIFSTITKTLVLEQNFPISSGITLAQEFEFAKDAGRIILTQLN